MKGIYTVRSIFFLVLSTFTILMVTNVYTVLAAPIRGEPSSLVLHQSGLKRPRPVITEYPIPTANSQPYGITQGPDGNLWFTESQGNNIGRITTSGSMTEFALPTPGSFPNSITTGSDGNLWFTATDANQIGRITPSGTITLFPVPSASSAPSGITAGHDGNMWFTESNGNKLASITPAGVISEFSIPTPNSSPVGIAADNGTLLWFAEQTGNNFGAFDTITHQFKEYHLKKLKNPCQAIKNPLQVTFGGFSGGKNQIWYSMQNGHCIVHGTYPGGPLGIPNKVSFETYNVPSGSNTYGVATASDLSCSYAEPEGNKIMSVPLKGKIKEYVVPTPNSMPWAITPGPNNTMWFTELTGNKIASIITSSSGGPLLQVSQDPFTNSTSQHKTQVEPDTYSNGSTIVSAFQSGRFFDGGSSDIGWATSTNNGATWKHGFLPGTTPYSTPPGPYARTSDPSVAFDAKHGVWIISFLALTSGNPVDVVVSRSTDGGLTWSNPVPVNNTGEFNDKNWSVCDDTASSPFYGNCYTEFDNVNQGDQELMSTSTDGGLNWGAAKAPSGTPHGLGGQPLVQPNGTVIVPFEDLNGTISAFTSTNGGSSWSAAVTVATLQTFIEPAPIRTSALPSAEIDGSGTVYVSWQDCRFESACSANDIVYSTSSDGTNWSAVRRVPADPVGSGVDHFIPGFAVDKSTSGSSAHLAVTYYYFTNANCNSSTCRLDVGYISSTNGGTSWSASKQLAGPMMLTWLANTNQGYMVGDYISTSIASNGKAYPVFAVAKKNNGSKFDEAMYTFKGGLAVAAGTHSSTAAVLFSGQTPHSGHLTAF